MKQTGKRARTARPTRIVPSLPLGLSLLLLIGTGISPVFAQTPTATPSPNRSDNRGIGVQSTGPTNTTQTQPQQQREAKPELVLQTGYNNFFGATRLVFSPDGKLLATTTFRSSTVKLWEIATGRELRNLSGGSQTGLSMSPLVAFSRDSRLLAAAAGDNSVKIWEVNTGREVQTLAGAQGSILASVGVYFIAFSADGRVLVTVSDAIRVWDTTTWRERRTLDSSSLNDSGFTGGDGGFALSADGSQLASVAAGGSRPLVKVWDLTTGRETPSISLPNKQITSAELCFAAGGRLLVAGIVEKKLKLWEVTAKENERELGPTTQDYSVIKFGSDGLILSLADGYAVKLWDVSNAAASRELPTLKVPNSGFFAAQGGASVGISDDGKKVATGGFDTQTILWETETGKQIRRMQGRTNMVYNVAFSADGTQLFSGGRTHWDLRTGRGLRVAIGPADHLFSLPSPDGRLLARWAPNNSAVTILEAQTGRQLQTLAPANGDCVVHRARFSADGRLLVTTYNRPPGRPGPPLGAAPGNLENEIKIWDVTSGNELRTLVVGNTANDVGFSRDGRVLATLGAQGQISLWDVASGNRLKDLTSSPAGNLGSFGNLGNPGALGTSIKMPTMADINSMMTNMLGAMSAGTMGRNVTSVAFSPDGQLLASGGVESKSNLGQTALMNIGQGQKKNSKKPADPQEIMKSIKIEAVGQVVLWDVTTGREIGALKGHGKGVTQVTFSRDGSLLASSSTDNTIKIWDVTTRRELRTLVGHAANIDSMDFSPDGRLLASASDDGGTFLWDAQTGEHLLTLVSLDDGGEWMVVTPQGLFDGSPVGWSQILWRYNQETFNVAPIEWFFNEFYYPGLLADIFAGKRPQVTLDVSKKDRRQPTVKLSLAVQPTPPATSVAERTVRVRVEVIEAAPDNDHRQGSGARDVRLFRNGSLVKVWHGDVLNGQATVTLEEEITVVAGENQLAAYAFNKENVKSKDARLLLTGAGNLKRVGTVYIIAVGVNEYENPRYNLKYAVADAQSFGEELRLRQTQVAGFARTEVISLLNQDATRANILSALKRLAGAAEPPSLKSGPLDRLKKAQPEDAVIIYFAGHGTAQGQRFYLIPHDLGYEGQRIKLTEEGLRSILEHSISDLQLEQAVEGLDAGHLLLVIDACNSGQALEAEEKRRGPMNSKGLAQLAYEKGMYILTAAQSYQAALEASQLGHGLLTYALVEEGLKTAIADSEPKDGVLSAREWLDFATERVPRMQEEKMREARGIRIAFTEGEQNIADPEKRSVQRPRVFYRREPEANPLVVAKPGTSPNP